MPALPRAQNDVTAANMRVYMQSKGGELHQERQETQPAQLQVHVSYFCNATAALIHYTFGISVFLFLVLLLFQMRVYKSVMKWGVLPSLVKSTVPSSIFQNGVFIMES